MFCTWKMSGQWNKQYVGKWIIVINKCQKAHKEPIDFTHQHLKTTDTKTIENKQGTFITGVLSTASAAAVRLECRQFGGDPDPDLDPGFRSASRMDINLWPYATYTQAFSYGSIVVPEILFHEKIIIYNHPPTHQARQLAQFDTTEPQLCWGILLKCWNDRTVYLFCSSLLTIPDNSSIMAPINNIAISMQHIQIIFNKAATIMCRSYLTAGAAETIRQGW